MTQIRSIFAGARGIVPLCALISLTACHDGSDPESVDPGGKGDHVGDACAEKLDLEPALGGFDFNRPVGAVQHASDESIWYVLEQRGVIWRIALEDDGTATPTAFLDFRDEVESRPNEAGLLGIALHPDFDLNGEVFLSYTALSSDNPGSIVSRISRFTTDDGGETLDAASEELIISVEQPFLNHNGGHIAFGPDGMLYIGWGDGGDANDPMGNGQNDEVLLGKLLRIDVDAASPYGIPSDNPLADSMSQRPEIYALGLRNPWQFSFDRETDTLWLADVGQNELEEINVIVSGGNYGWNEREGTSCFLDFSCPGEFLDPVAEYGRNEGISVTGGFVYRGSENPELVGKYLFADYGSGTIWALEEDPDEDDQFIRTTLASTSMNPSAFAEGLDGEIYVIDHSSGQILSVALQEAADDCDDDGDGD